MNRKYLHFPEGFLWGTSTAAHQVEGGNTHNNWYRFELEGKIDRKEVSGIAVDHYNRYEEDFDIIKKLNQNIYRFSIEWSRIEPIEGHFDENEIEHYRAILEALKKREIKSMMTLFHFTLPIWFEDMGGFTRKENIKYFMRFVERVIKEYGKSVDYWVTINEPVNYAFEGYLRGAFPPEQQSLLQTWKVVNNLAIAHGQVYDLIHEKMPKALVAASKNMIFAEPYNKQNHFEKLLARLVDWLWDRKFLADTWQKSDFLGVQYYTHLRLRRKNKGELFGIAKEYGMTRKVKRKDIVSDQGWELYPKGVYESLMYLKRFQKPIIITETGLADRDDVHRYDYIREQLLWTHKAIEQGADVRGYIYWTLMDNFEWTFGRDPRFGLVEIDYENDLERKIRPSAFKFAKICKENRVPI